MDDTTIFNDHVGLSVHPVCSFKAVLLEDSLKGESHLLGGICMKPLYFPPRANCEKYCV